MMDEVEVSVNAEVVLQILQAKAASNMLLKEQIEAAVWQAAYRQTIAPAVPPAWLKDNEFAMAAGTEDEIVDTGDSV